VPRFGGLDGQLLTLNEESQEPGKPREQRPPRLLAGVRPRCVRESSIGAMPTHLGWDMQFVEWQLEHQKEVGVFTTVRLDAGGQSCQ
jgi:hypothetical protein